MLTWKVIPAVYESVALKELQAIGQILGEVKFGQKN